MDSHADLDPQNLLAHMGWIRALARKLVADQHLAEDLAQDAYVTALERAPSDSTRLRPWLGGVLGNLASRVERKDSPRPVPDCSFEPRTGADSCSPASLTERVEAQGALVQIVLGLDERQRSLVLEHYFEDKSVRLIARELGEPETNVSRHLRAAHVRLRRGLERKLGRDPAVWSLTLLGLPLRKVVPASASTGGSLLAGKLLIASLFVTASLAVTFLVLRIAGSGTTTWSPRAAEAAVPSVGDPDLASATMEVRAISEDFREEAPLIASAPAPAAPVEAPAPPEPPPVPFSDASYDDLLAAIEATLDGQIDLGALIGLSQELLDAVDLAPGTKSELDPLKRLAYTLPTSFDTLTATISQAETTNPAVHGPAISLRLELAPRNGVLHTVNGVVRTSGILELRPLNDADGHPDQLVVFTDLMPAGQGLNHPASFNPDDFRTQGVNLLFDPKSPGNTSGIVHGRKGRRSSTQPIPLTLVGSTPTQADLERFSARLDELLDKPKG